MAIGRDFEDRRAAAFAGLITYGALDKFEPLKWHGKPLGISIGSYDRESQALLRLIANNWENLNHHLKEKAINRFIEDDSDSTNFWNLMSTHIAANSLLKQNFMDYCEKTKQALDFQSLKALSKEFPKSDILRRQCLLALPSGGSFKGSSWYQYQSYFEAAYILRNQFEGEADIVNQLVETVKLSNYSYGITALSIYDPENIILEDLIKKTDEFISDGNFLTPIVLLSSKANSEPFFDLVKKTINRPYYHLGDFQDRINVVIKSRIISDETFSNLIKDTLEFTPTEG
jgi:hypothetical protein